MNLNDYAFRLSQLRTLEGYGFECQYITGDPDVLHIELQSGDSVPIFMTQTDSQILCIVYLWKEEDVIPETREAMLEMMLDTSIAIPLSAYARTDSHYVLYGSLSVASSFDRVIEEIVTLNQNTFDVMTAMEEFLH